MSLADSGTFRCNLHRYDGLDQLLQIRIGHSSRLLTESPFSGYAFNIVHGTLPTTMADAQFPLPLRELEDPLFCRAYIEEFLSSYNLGATIKNAIARSIASFVVQMACENYEMKFYIVAEIDYIQMFWMDDSATAAEEEDEDEEEEEEETEIFDDFSGRRGAPETAIERLKEKFDEFGGEDLRNCSVCYDEMKDGGEEVSRIPCGHVYHKYCVLTWLQRNNSCPLCTKKLEV
ncbi:E3 ubiquitin-protein ligase RNF165-like [Cucurbita pepo subsp. pepo]|uniref:E3 ubiquitin-protein ligase RNF165-like n=1 Tax=Cucurbita pepo subsp. pepo TaxID=3664 RepID=UPI000C9D93E9|nr:E3 ubiquitin-protein ligase RNF165-like [Cucurbita pepo subsp. pepo]